MVMMCNIVCTLLLTTALSSPLTPDENCTLADTCSGDDRSSMLQIRAHAAPQLELLEQACLPKSTNSGDAGYSDAYRGWYDVQGCGTCNDYCRWVGNSGSGGDPAIKTTHGASFWSCRVAGGSKGYTSKGYYSTWSYAKCAGEGAKVQPPAKADTEGCLVTRSAKDYVWVVHGDGTRNWISRPTTGCIAKGLIIPDVSVYTQRHGGTGKYSLDSSESTTACQLSACKAGTASPSSTCDETLTGTGAAYRGCQDKTRSGRTCQKWTSQKPHGHGISATKNKGKGIGDHNFCRNPDGEPTLWCYTTDSKKRWEFCDPKVAKTQVSKPKVTSTPCGFETSAKPYCATWSNAAGDQFDWSRKSGSTPSSRTGPSKAHSGNHYMYIEASFKKGGDTAILQSVSTTFHAGAWLSFQYHMYGPRIGTLKVVFKEPAAGPVIVWQRNGDLGNKWGLADIDLSPYAGKTGVIQLHGIITHKCANFLGDIAIDEISLTPGSGSAPAPTSAPSTPAPTSAPSTPAPSSAPSTPAPTSAPSTGKSGQSDFFDRIDTDNSKEVVRDEFKKAVQDGKVIVEPGKGGQAMQASPTTPSPTDRFNRVDSDNSKSISRDELKKALDAADVIVPVKP